MRVLIDTDAGVDDAIALTLAMRLGRVHLVTSSFGNTTLFHVKRNVNRVIKLASKWSDKSNLPKTASGAARPRDGTERPIDASYFHGSDGLGDVDPSDPGYVALDSTEDNEEKDGDEV